VVFRKGNIVAALPACDFPAAEDRVLRSHGGLTYGGLIVGPSAGHSDVAESFALIAALGSEAGYRRLLYKSVPLPFQFRPRQEDQHILWTLGAQVVRRDIASVVRAAEWNESALTSGRRQNSRKFGQTNCSLEFNSPRWNDYWLALVEVLQERHDARPTHSIEEMRRLVCLCPDHIKLHVVLLDGRVVAGIVEYLERRWIHTQYIAATLVGRANYALDGLLIARLRQARDAGVDWYSLGTSMEDDGRAVNTGLLQYKESLGAVGVVNESVELSLEPAS
jgi:hypothetical protein